MASAPRGPEREGVAAAGEEPSGLRPPEAVPAGLGDRPGPPAPETPETKRHGRYGPRHGRYGCHMAHEPCARSTASGLHRDASARCSASGFAPLLRTLIEGHPPTMTIDNALSGVEVGCGVCGGGHQRS